MKHIKFAALAMVLALSGSVWAACGICNRVDTDTGCDIALVDTTLANSPIKRLEGYKNQNKINDDYYFTYKFTGKPRLGTSMMEVKVYGINKKVSQDFEVIVMAEVPALKSTHATTMVKLQPNKKGIFRAPVKFDTLGVWKINLKFVKDGKLAYEGYFHQKISK